MELFVHGAVDVVEGAEVSRDCEAAVGYCGEEGADVDEGAERGEPKLQQRVVAVGEEEGGERCREDNDEAAHDALEHEHRSAGTVHGVAGVVCQVVERSAPSGPFFGWYNTEGDESVSIRQ